MAEKQKYISKEMAVEKVQKYCAYQDRCHKEVRYKLVELGLRGDELEEVLSELIRHDFLNEERFARSFCRGKFRMKKWGRNKIIRELKQRDVSDYCIKKGLTEIEDDEYHNAMNDLLLKKFESVNKKDLFKRREKAANYMIRKGYDPGEIWTILKSDKNYRQ